MFSFRFAKSARLRAPTRRDGTARHGTGQLMSRPSPAWPQRDEPPPCGTATALPPASSDSDSGCALEEYPEPPAEPAPPEVPACFESRPTDQPRPADRSLLRVRALLQQLPPQDCDERYCPDLEEEERKQLRAFSARRRRDALGQGVAVPVPGARHGYPCRKCGKRLSKGDLGIAASWLGEQLWHPPCFCCHVCHQPLVDLIYFQQDGRIYCGRHHAELFRPRCASCDQLIFLEECIEAEGRRWHPEHFCCLECDAPLCGQRYVMRSGRPCCRSCFNSLFAEPCQACGEPIGVDSEEATHQGLHWHACAACFCCSLCQKPLRGQPLTARCGRLFCSESCSLGQDASSAASTTSDSSDSAFVSAPSPDSTPVSRASHATRAGSTAAAGGCRQRVERAGRGPECSTCRGLGEKWKQNQALGTSLGIQHMCAAPQGCSSSCGLRFGEDNPGVHPGTAPAAQATAARQAQPSSPSPFLACFLPEMLPDQASTHPAFRSPEDHGAAVERSKDSVCTGMLESSASHPSNVQPCTEGPCRLLGGPEPRILAGDGNPRFQVGLPPARSSPCLQDIDPQDIMEEDDSWCPTCSSSSDSDSEEEGFFFGKPIPKPGMNSVGREPQRLEQAGCRKAKLRGSSKHCSVS
ncbi:prickle-like protein 4 isoform X1 [Phasianus colchicus]|uniref:prickle-like protein 4 isoform X1 n=1 Tax=Phasianus colchicus TaxID=9054 RepID=UPI00129DDB2C|nr:prickle-like protein 4 isoform X1 [Phasianus colchicus]